MRDSGRGPGSGDAPTPPPDNDRGGQSDRPTSPDTRQGGDQTRERSRTHGASPPVPHKAPSRWGIPHRPAPNDGSGARPTERPGPDTGAGRTRARSRVRPAPREDRATSDAPPRTVRTEAPSTEITGLRSRGASDRRELTRLQADDRDGPPNTAGASGPGAPDDPGPPAPPDHPEPDEPDQPTALDAANAEIADLRKQLADSKTELDTAKTKIGELEGRIEAVKAEADAKIETVKAEADAKVEAAKAEFDAKLESSQEFNDAKMTALESRFEAAIDGLRANSERPELAGADRPEKQRPEFLPALEPARSPTEKVGGRELAAAGQDGDKQRAPWYERGPQSPTLTWTSGTISTALTGLTHYMPPGPSFAATFAGSLVGWGITSLSWLRDRKKKQNAN